MNITTIVLSFMFIQINSIVARSIFIFLIFHNIHYWWWLYFIGFLFHILTITLWIQLYIILVKFILLFSFWFKLNFLYLWYLSILISIIIDINMIIRNIWLTWPRFNVYIWLFNLIIFLYALILFYLILGNFFNLR